MHSNDGLARWYALLRAAAVLLALVYAMGSLAVVLSAAPVAWSDGERVASLERDVQSIERRVNRLEGMAIDLRLDRLERDQESYMRMQEQQRQMIFGLYVPLVVLSIDVLVRFYLSRRSQRG